MIVMMNNNAENKLKNLQSNFTAHRLTLGMKITCVNFLFMVKWYRFNIDWGHVDAWSDFVISDVGFRFVN